MTEDQIKAIAEEYVGQLTLNDVNTENCITKSGVVHVLKFLSTRYCIVEWEKVMEEYEEACDEIDFETETKSVLHQNVALGRKCLLESLFGTSMFNQNEE